MNIHGEKEKTRSRTAGALGAGKSQRISFRFDRTMIIGRALKVWTNALLKVVALAATVVAIAVQAQAPAANPEPKKDQKSELAWKPRVQPGTTEYARMATFAEKIGGLDIPKADAEKLSTRELMKVCLSYNFLTTMQLVHTVDHGPAMIISNFYGFTELFKRSDAGEVYLEELAKKTPGANASFTYSQTHLIRLLRDGRTKAIFSRHQITQLAQILLRAFPKPGAVCVNPEPEIVDLLDWCFSDKEVFWENRGELINKDRIPKRMHPRDKMGDHLGISFVGDDASISVQDLDAYRQFAQTTGYAE